MSYDLFITLGINDSVNNKETVKIKVQQIICEH